MKKQINRLSTWFCRIFDNQHKDEIKGCLDIIFKGHTTEQSIHIFIEVKRLYELELNSRHTRNVIENEQIKSYFKPKVNHSVIKDKVFDHPIQNVQYL